MTETMLEMAERLDQELKEFNKVSSMLLRRKTKQSFEFCQKLSGLIYMIRNRAVRKMLSEIENG